MNYFEHHIGDHAKVAGHLSLLEEGVYMRLKGKYLASESALSSCLSETERLVSAKQTGEKKAVRRIMDEFFVLGSDGLQHNPLWDEEIQRVKEKSTRARDSANARWHGCERTANAMRSHSNGNAVASKSHADRNANAMLSNLQSPDSREDIPTPTLPAEQEGRSSRDRGLNPRALGTNPRAKGTNPRALGTNRHAERDEHHREQDQATVIWSELLVSNGSRPKRDPRIQAAIDAVGGWSAIRMRTDDEEPRLRRRFVDAYLGSEA